MRVYFLIALLFVFSPAFAQEDSMILQEKSGGSALGEVVEDPYCFNVINKAPYTVYGSINTNYYIRDDGLKSRHKSSFRLETDKQVEFCTFGPFYENRKLELVLRTLIPIFNCKTGVEGDVIIYGRRKSEGGTETWAECL